MIRIILLFISLNTLAYANTNELIKIDSLGQLQLNFATVQQVEGYDGRPIKATVSFKPGEAFQIIAPFSAQSQQLLVTNGAFVKKDTPLLLLSGSEVHHFMETLEAKKALYDMASLRFHKNKKLFQQKSISSDKWALISQDYYQSKIDYGHLRHFNEYVDSSPSEDSIVIKAKLDGIYTFSDTQSRHAEETLLGQILPTASLRLKVQVPPDLAEMVKSITVVKCKLNIEQANQISSGYFVTLWSEPISKECGLLIGQTVQAIPKLLIQTFKIPKSSVFTWNRSSYIFVKKQSHLIPVLVTIISSNSTEYFVNTEYDLSSSEVLSSSVSAAQGILLGMGGD